MFYKCRSCNEEVERGWIPSATTGLYPIVLLMCSVCTLSAVLLPAVRRVKELPRPAEPPPPEAWWVSALLLGGVLLVLVVGMILFALLFASIEYLVTRREPCPKCGSRRWSWGYTRGFGL